MPGLTYKLRVLPVLMAQARKIEGTHYQKRSFVLHELSMMEIRLRAQHNYTLAMWTHQLLCQVRGACTVQEVLDALEQEERQPPASNTGVNPPESVVDTIIKRWGHEL